MDIAAIGLGAIGLLMIWVGYFMLRHQATFRRIYFRLAHFIFGERLPGGFWKPVSGGIAFILCGVAAFVIGAIKALQDMH